MSGTDYTQTTNYGLYKPISNADINQWGSHLNANADTLDGLMHGFLPLAGGTPTGPIMITATGGSVARSAQDRAADVANVLDYGADPTGVADSTVAFRGALATGHDVFVPRGTYLITGQLTLAANNTPQALRGQGHASVLLIDTRFDPTVTTGVVVIPNQTNTDCRGEVSDLVIKFVQPPDLVKTTTAVSAVGATTITVNNTSGIVVGMQLLNWTARNVRGDTNSIPSLGYFSVMTPTVVASIAGNVITLANNAVSGGGVASGDLIHFAPVRSMFKTIANGATAGPGGTGVQYPWAIYNNNGQTTLLQNLMFINAWNGIWLRGSSFRIEQIYMNAFNVGMDIDQCYNFPQITNYDFWQWGMPPNESMAAIGGTYYDGVTVAANFGETDGVGIVNFQTWAGILNLTSAWSWGQFTNLMLDGNNSNMNILAGGGGFVQITNGYSSKGNLTQPGPCIHVKTAATFRTTFSNFNMGSASPIYNGLMLESGILQFSDTYFWDGLQNPNLPLISLTGGVLYLDNVLLDVGGGGTNVYIQMSGTAALHMYNCAILPAPVLSGASAVVSGVNNTVTFSNVAWNGWLLFTPGNNLNNGATLVAPLDITSMQSGSLGFAQLGATQHYNTAYGADAMGLAIDAVSNTASFGALAGYGAQGQGNTFIGAVSGYSGGGSTGNHNTCLGAITGYSLTTGANNTFVGYNIGTVTTTGSGNLYIAAGSDNFAYSATEGHTFRLGDNAINLMRATNIDTATPHLFLDWLPASTTYANDAAAATGGVAVGQLYRNGSAVMVRVS